MNFISRDRIPVPVQASEYRRVYIPQPDIYRGIDTPSFREGTRFDQWITNDFTFAQDSNGFWHAFGITHPKTPGFVNDMDCGSDPHEAENQLFHAVYQGKSLSELLQKGSFLEQPKVLYPQERPGEPAPCWAPCVIKKADTYFVFYTPGQMRLAVSQDLYTWQPKGALFEGMPLMRDPYVLEDNGLYYLVYLEDCLMFRTSMDLLHWSDPAVLQENPFGQGACQESPCLFKRGDYYYLMWCIFDNHNGSYDDRTFVFAGKSPTDFRNRAPLTMLRGHASEIFLDGGESYLFSTFYPENGINMAKIGWR